MLLPEKVGYNGPFSLEALRKLFNFNTGNAHDAQADAAATVQLFNFLINIDSAIANSSKSSVGANSVTSSAKVREEAEVAEQSSLPMIILMISIGVGLLLALNHFLAK